MQEIPDRASILEPGMVFPERFSRLGVGCSGKLPPIRLVGGGGHGEYLVPSRCDLGIPQRWFTWQDLCIPQRSYKQVEIGFPGHINNLSYKIPWLLKTCY